MKTSKRTHFSSQKVCRISQIPRFRGPGEAEWADPGSTGPNRAEPGLSDHASAEREWKKGEKKKGDRRTRGRKRKGKHKGEKGIRPLRRGVRTEERGRRQGSTEAGGRRGRGERERKNGNDGPPFGVPGRWKGRIDRSHTHGTRSEAKEGGKESRRKRGRRRKGNGEQ